MINLKDATTEQGNWKQAVTNDFLRGDSIATIANRCACHKLRVEQVLREAISGLAALTAKEAAPIELSDLRVGQILDSGISQIDPITREPNGVMQQFVVTQAAGK